jgi:hypothetical protein
MKRLILILLKMSDLFDRYLQITLFKRFLNGRLVPQGGMPPPIGWSPK